MAQKPNELAHPRKAPSDVFSITLIIFFIFYSLYLALPVMTIDGVGVRGFFLAKPLGAVTLAYSVFYISMRNRKIHRKYWILFKIALLILFMFSSIDTLRALSASFLIQVDGIWWGALFLGYGTDCFVVSVIAFVVLLFVKPKFNARNGGKSTDRDQPFKEVDS